MYPTLLKITEWYSHHQSDMDINKALIKIHKHMANIEEFKSDKEKTIIEFARMFLVCCQMSSLGLLDGALAFGNFSMMFCMYKFISVQELEKAVTEQFEKDMNSKI